MIDPKTIPAVILAGGQSSRFGPDDKALARLAGKTVIDHVIDRLAPQIGPIAVNVTLGPVVDHIADTRPDVVQLPEPHAWNDRGPQAGVRAAMQWAVSEGSGRVLTVPCDTPFLPPDLAARLTAAYDADGGYAATAVQSKWCHWAVTLWDATLDFDINKLWRDEPLSNALFNLADLFQSTHVAFDDLTMDGVDPFFNINTQEDLAVAERWLA